jgi:type IV pilus assembly protein PilF
MIRSLKVLMLTAHLAVLGGCITTETNPVETSPEDAAKANLQLGATYLQRGELGRAREKLEKAVSQDPKLPNARVYLAVLYERIGEPEDADDEYRAAIRLAPKDPSVANAYGGYLCRTDRRSDGIKHFVKAAENPLYQTPEVAYTNAAVCAQAIPDEAAAESYLRQALAVNPRFRDALLRIAVLSLDTERPLQARAFLERFHAAGPATADSLAMAVRAETALGDEAAAESYRRRLRDEFPQRADSLGAAGGGM